METQFSQEDKPGYFWLQYWIVNYGEDENDALSACSPSSDIDAMLKAAVEHRLQTGDEFKAQRDHYIAIKIDEHTSVHHVVFRYEPVVSFGFSERFGKGTAHDSAQSAVRVLKERCYPKS